MAPLGDLLITISSGELCSAQGYRPMTEQQCSDLADVLERSFAAYDGSGHVESGCLSWSSSELEFLRNTVEEPCPAGDEAPFKGATCYCEAGSPSPP